MYYEPKIGDKLYLYTPCSNGWVSMVRDPYDVVDTKLEGKTKTCIVRAAKLIFNGVRYYDTVADDIVPDINGKLVTLRWNEKNQRWQESPAGSYPRVAKFGKYEHQPYLD